MLNFKKPFIIAEIGINHNGNLDEAIELIDQAKKSGADAVKFQTYKTEKRVKKNSSIFNILKKCELSNNDFIKLKKYSDKKKILFFSTPFDTEAVKFLKKINVKLFKISSFDISNYELIDQIIKTKTTTLISTGMASLKEIYLINKIFKNKKIKHFFLHCVSKYPNDEKNSFLNNLKFLSNKLKMPVGLSDHTDDINICNYAYFMGARIFEKHFKLSNNHKCVDSKVSITPKQLLQLRKNFETFKNIEGVVKFGVKPCEKDAKVFKRVVK